MKFKREKWRRVLKGPFTNLTFMILFFFVGYLSGIVPPWEIQASVSCPSESLMPCSNPFYDCISPDITEIKDCEAFPECTGVNCEKMFLEPGEYAGTLPPSILVNAPLIMLLITISGIVLNFLFAVITEARNKRNKKRAEEAAKYIKENLGEVKTASALNPSIDYEPKITNINEKVRK